MKVLNAILFVLLDALIAVNLSTTSLATSAAPTKETVYQRVMRTQTIRCGYSVWAPLAFVDPNTGAKKGIFPDLMEEAGRRLGLKIVWQEEIGWGSLVEVLQSHRVDMACGGYWLNPGRIKNLSSTVAQIYAPLYIWGRSDDGRSFRSMEELNSAGLTVDRIDGSVEAPFVQKRFPQAKHLSMTELSTESDKILSLTTKKTDFTVLEPSAAKAYLAHNPGKIKNLFPGKPLVTFPTVMLMAPEETQMKEMIDNILLAMEQDGTLDAILARYDAQDSFLRNPGLILTHQ